jgi:hypothetical protein
VLSLEVRDLASGEARLSRKDACICRSSSSLRSGVNESGQSRFRVGDGVSVQRRWGIDIEDSFVGLSISV